MQTPSNRPTHRVYAIEKRGDNSNWTDIGALWPHKDGKGFNLKLSYLPLNGADIVIREPKPRSNADDPGAETTATVPAEFEGGF